MITQFTFKEFCRACQDVTNSNFDDLNFIRSTKGETIAQRMFEAFVEKEIYSESFQSWVIINRMLNS